jgi:hypothetical protein
MTQCHHTSIYFFQMQALLFSYETSPSESRQYFERILDSNTMKAYLDNYSPSLRRTYYAGVSSNETGQHISTIDTDLDDDDETPRASVQVTQIRDNKERSLYSHSSRFHRCSLVRHFISCLFVNRCS